MYHYQIFQFPVASELALPAESLVAPDPDPDGQITIRKLDRRWPRPDAGALQNSIFDGQLTSYVGESGALICVQDYLQIHVDPSGRQISVFAEPRAEGEAALYAISMGVTLCAALRDTLCLHGASVEIDGRRIGLLAESGTGKSTTAWALLRVGARFASDDAILIQATTPDYHAIPSGSLYPKVNLDLLDWSDLPAANAQRVLPDSLKFWYPLPSEQRAWERRPLAHLFLLRPRSASDPGKTVDVQRQRGISALTQVLRHSQAGQLAARLRPEREHLACRFASLLQTLPVSILSYPKRFDTLPAVVEAIRATAGTSAVMP